MPKHKAAAQTIATFPAAVTEVKESEPEIESETVAVALKTPTAAKKDAWHCDFTGAMCGAVHMAPAPKMFTAPPHSVLFHVATATLLHNKRKEKETRGQGYGVWADLQL